MNAEDGFSLQESCVLIIGLGLMGGSLAMALKGHCATLLGADPDPVICDLALRRNIVERAYTEPAGLLPEADVIVLAAPVPAILECLQALPALTDRPGMVIDLGSSKQTIVRAMEALPERFEPLGGHPICGKERLSLGNADAGLYQGAPFVLTPLARTTTRAKDCARQLVSAVGARAVWMDAAAHDAALAATSHVPYLIGSALALSIPSTAVPLAGPGFRSTARLAATPNSMMLGVLQTNREHVLAALDGFRARLDALENALQNDDQATLQSLLVEASTTYIGMTQA